MAIEIYCRMWQKITIRIFFIHLIEKVPTYIHIHMHITHAFFRSSKLSSRPLLEFNTNITINTHTFTFLLSSIYFLFQLLFGFPFLLFLLFLFLFVGSAIYLNPKKRLNEPNQPMDFQSHLPYSRILPKRPEHQARKKNQTNNLNCT